MVIHKDHFINHVALVLDASGSMYNHRDSVEKAFESLVGHLREKSLVSNQETRCSLYLFNHNVTCDVFDMDVTRLQTIRGAYNVGGSTKLIDATIQSIDDMKKLPELYGDHGFLVYVITDGEENNSLNSRSVLKSRLSNLPENWTIAAMVPDRRGVKAAVSYGFPEGNVEEWDTSGDFKRVEQRIRDTVVNYMDNRATGVRGTKTLFSTKLKGTTVREVRKSSKPLASASFTTLIVKDKDLSKSNQIRDFVENKTKNGYVVGNAHYELTKSELVQEKKRILIRNNTTKEVFDNGRDVLGLPAGRIRVRPGDHGNWKIFVESTSVNRKLIPNTELIVLK